MIYLLFAFAVIMLALSYYEGYVQTYSSLGIWVLLLIVLLLVAVIISFSKVLVRMHFHKEVSTEENMLILLTIFLLISMCLLGTYEMIFRDDCNGGLKEFMNSKNKSILGGRNLVTDYIDKLYLYHNKCEDNTGNNAFVYFPKETRDDSTENYIYDTILGNSKFNLYKTVYNSSSSYQKFKAITQYEWRDRSGVDIYNGGYSDLTGGSLDMLYDIMTDTQRKQYDEMK